VSEVSASAPSLDLRLCRSRQTGQCDRVWKDNGRTQREGRAVLMCKAVRVVFAIQHAIGLGRIFHLMLVRIIAMMSVDRTCDRQLIMPRHMCIPSGARHDQRA